LRAVEPARAAPTDLRGNQERFSMNLYAPNIALFVVAGCLAMIGVLSALPIELPIPGLSAANAAWYIFLGWFLLAAGSVLPPPARKSADNDIRSSAGRS
jgi:hypothetical protein